MNGTLANLSLNSITSIIYPKVVDLPNGALDLSTFTSGYPLGKMDVPLNYVLNFDIKPIVIVPGWSNIIHFTKDLTNIENSGSRMPAVWLSPGKTTLHIRTSTLNNNNDGLWETPALPLGSITRVSIQMVGPDMAVFFNETMVSSMKFSSEWICIRTLTGSLVYPLQRSYLWSGIEINSIH